MRKRVFKCVAAAMAAVMAVTSVPLSAQAAVKISVSKCVVSKGDSIDLDMKGAKEQKGKYSTSKKSVASVTKKGVVKAKRKGKVKIYVTYGSLKKKCIITVK